MGRKDAKNWAKLGKIGQNWAKKLLKKCRFGVKNGCFWLFFCGFYRLFEKKIFLKNQKYIIYL
jgi:hypothetical protein